ncbi:MAG: hypothetical protein AAGA90_02805 [Actinomycetota bacterium]
MGPDPTRTLLPEPIGREAARYLRTWNVNVTPERSTVLLHEQWFHPDGTAHASVSLLTDPPAPPLNTEDDVAKWADLRQIPESADTLRDRAQGQYFGFPEQVLPDDPERLGELLASPDAASAVPGVFMSLMSAGGADGSYLPDSATTVREIVRLLPTTLETRHREAMVAVLGQTDGAVATSGEQDMLGRPSDLIVIPLEVTDPTSGSRLGLLHASFWFNPETTTPQQVEWMLVDGELPLGVDVFLDRTVIIAAGEVAAIPDEPRPDNPTPGTPTTIAPSEFNAAFTATLDCLGLPDPEGPPDDFEAGVGGMRLTDSYLDAFDGTPTLVVVVDPAVADLDTVASLASNCSDRHGTNIEIGVGGDPGGFLDQPIFSGQGWQLDVGEERNPPTDTYKVCHSLRSSGDGTADGLNLSGCGNWPDPDRMDQYILDAVATLLPDGSGAVVFVDLGILDIDRVIVTADGIEIASTTPFAMPQSQKQFAAVELAEGTNTAIVRVVDPAGALLDETGIQVEGTG